MKLNFILLTILSILATGHGEAASQALLQATIDIFPMDPSRDREKIQPVAPVLFSATVSNVGTQPSQPGTLNIRYVFPEQLSQHSNDLLFQTEIAQLPSIAPGQTVNISFKTPQQLPSIYDFVRNDWGMRHYEAIATIGGNEQTIGITSVVFSAYYYERPPQAIPKAVPSK